LNYPFQAAMLTGFRSPPATFEDPVPRNLSGAITADDGGVQSINEAPGALVDEGGVGPYAGAYGLGRQLALAGRVVRPFRRVLSAQAIYRREAVE
jgi:hypothetical protein